MLYVISLLLVSIIIVQVCCLLQIQSVKHDLQHLLNDETRRETLVDYAIILEDQMQKLKEDFQKQLDQTKQHHKKSDEEKWEAFRRAFTPPEHKPRIGE